MKVEHSIIRFTILLFSISVLSCKDTKKEGENASEDSMETIVFSKALIDETNPAVWIYDYDKDIPLKNWEIMGLNNSPQEWIDFLNSQNRGVYLEFSKHSGDTLYVKIQESNYLTQNMGSAGADAYMSVATFTLTETKNVNYVNFDFVEGDHATPGTYSRQYYVERNKTRFH